MKLSVNLLACLFFPIIWRRFKAKRSLGPSGSFWKATGMKPTEGHGSGAKLCKSVVPSEIF